MMKQIANFFSKPQDVLTKESKDRLVNVYRHNAGTTGGCVTNTLGRNEQVSQGQNDLLEIKSFQERKWAMDGDMDIHLEQQESLRKLFRK